jgi:UDP-N-acetyl-D-mannosaminuronic acid dehydrogenase
VKGEIVYMPLVLHLKPEEIDAAEKRAKYTVCVAGCGPKGLLYGIAFAEAGFKVICTDADQSLVKRLMKGKTPFSKREMEVKLKSLARTGMLSVTNDLKGAVALSDIILLTITPKLDEKKKLNYAEAENSCKQVGVALQRGSLVIQVGVAAFGFTEGVVKETLENASGLKVGEDFGVAYSPTLISRGHNSTESISNQELKVAANDKTSLETAATILLTLTTKGVTQVLGLKIAELATLFDVARRDMNAALTNELAILCEKAGVDYFETLKLLEGCRESSHVPAVAEEDGTDEAYFLIDTAENLDTKLRLPALARQINDGMVKHAVNLTQDILRSCGKTLRRARIAVLGTAEPKTTGDIFIETLEAKSAKINLYDPLFFKNEAADLPRMPKRSLNEAVEGSDCIILLTRHDQFKRLNFKNLRALMRTPAAIVDLAGVLEPQKVEKEGFIYRGLGRGTEKK